MEITTERQLLDAIAETPDDAHLRLAYADWLEEHGDLRSEMVRVEEEMRSLPIYSDRYWELKPKRHAFQDFCDEKHYELWCSRLGYHRRYQRIFVDVPDLPKYRWRLIREFIERWHGIRLPDVGGHVERIEQIESRVGVSLPPSIREWLSLAYDLGGQFGDVFRDRLAVEPMSRHRALSLMILAEGDVRWAVFDRNLNQDDPAVESFSQYAATDAGGFEHTDQAAASTSCFALAHASHFLGRGSYFRASSATVEAAAARHQLAPVQFDGLTIYETDSAVLWLHERDMARISIWGKIRDDQLHPFFQELLGDI